MSVIRYSDLELFSTYMPENLRALKPGSDCKLLPLKESYHGEELEFVAPFLPENPNILEAGAHHGHDTKVMASRWPKGKIFAFEPSPFNFSILENNVVGFQNIKISPFALFSKTEYRTFYICVQSGLGSSFFYKNHLFPNDNDVPTRVFCIKLDEWCQNNQQDRIDYMWLDMEGSELEMFKGASETLKTVKAISVELSFLEGRNGIPLFPEVLAFLEDSGFTLHKLLLVRGGWLPKGYERTDYGQATGVFIRSELLNLK